MVQEIHQARTKTHEASRRSWYIVRARQPKPRVRNIISYVYLTRSVNRKRLMSIKYNDPRISRIIELELRVTRAVINGHQPAENDEYENDRLEIQKLRKEIENEKRSNRDTKRR